MNTSLKIFWNNNPIPLEEKVSKSDIVVEIPFGVMITSPSGSSLVTSVNSKVGDVVLVASDVGATTESYVDAETNNLQVLLQTSIDTKADATAVSQALGTKADLIGGIIPANQLPSFVDDVLEYNSLASFPLVGEASKIYIAIDTNKIYRWSSTQYVEISEGGVALGETAATAYRGDRGKIAYDHSLSQGNPHNTTTSEIVEGVNKYFTDVRVRNTIVSGLVKTDSSNVSSTDSVEVALGKLAAKSEQSTSIINWVNLFTIGGFHPNMDLSKTQIEMAKINGQLWIRGHYTTSASSISANSEIFYVTNSAWLVDYSSYSSLMTSIFINSFYNPVGSSVLLHKTQLVTTPTPKMSMFIGGNLAVLSTTILQPTPIGKAL